MDASELRPAVGTVEPPEAALIEPKPVAEPAGTGRTLHGAGRLGVVHSWLVDIERDWLGMTVPPWRTRAAEGAFVPDEPEAYCPRCARTVRSLAWLKDAAGFACERCKGTRPGWSRMVRLGEHDGVLREALLNVKFSAWHSLGRELGRELGRRLAPQLSRAGILPEQAVIVPVPTSFWRRLTRGIDHPLAIARGVRDITGGPLVRALRRKHGPSQLSASADQRRRQMRGVMRGVCDLSGRQVVLIDDVCTTGATLREACRALGAASPGGLAAQRVWAAVLTRAELGLGEGAPG